MSIDVDKLRIVADRLRRDREDLRHTVLDIAGEFLAATEAAARIVGPVGVELRELREEFEAVRPAIASQRTTSVLFDRAGAGQMGRERARSIADRVVAVAKCFEQT